MYLKKEILLCVMGNLGFGGVECPYTGDDSGRNM